MNALRVNVAGLLKETAGAARDYPIDVAPQEYASLLEDARPLAPLTGHLRLMRTPQSIFARGRLATRVATECSRCLEDAQVDIAFDLEAEYFPEVDIVTGQGLPAPEDDLAFSIDQNHELDLGEAVRQHLLLELPMRLVCSETCAGLCPKCGANLNNGPCGCKAEPEDDRFAPLKALLEGQIGTR